MLPLLLHSSSELILFVHLVSFESLFLFHRFFEHAARGIGLDSTNQNIAFTIRKYVKT